MSFNSFESKLYSQNGEDGLIEHIFKQIGEKSKLCVEFGFGAAECNTLNLMLNKGWKGWLFDSDAAEVLIAKIQHQSHPQIRIDQVQLTKRNINAVFEQAGVPHEIDLLSVDVDGVDWHLWNALTWTRPRVVCIEYNADFGTEEAIAVKYRDGFNRFNFHPQYHGASLKALVMLGRLKGMKLVGCDSTGHNAFFVGDAEPMVPLSVKEAWHPTDRAQWDGMLGRFREQFGFDHVVEWK